MPAKKKPTLAFTRQRSAADNARREGRWATAISNYTRALAHKNLPADVQIELLETRASCYKKTGNLKAEALDRKALSTLLKSQLEERNAALQQGQAELGIVASIAEALVDRADYERIGQIVGQKLQEFFDAEIASIGLFDKQSGMITVPYYYEKGKLKKVTPFKYGEGVASHVLKTRKPIYIPTAREQGKYGVIYAKELPAESMLMAPIISGKLALGAISIQDSKPNAYSKNDLRILNAIANSMSVALENARLFGEIQSRNLKITEALEQQTATSDILRAMANSPTEIQPILDAVANNAARLCEADDVQIYSVETGGLRQVAHFGPLPALQDGETLPLVPGLVSGRAVLERRAIHIEDARKLSKAEYPESVKLQRRLGHHTVLTSPLMRKANAIGAIVVRRNEVRPFTERQITLLATFADQAAIAIENVRLFDQLQTRNREISEALEQQTATSDILQIIASSPEDIDGVLRAIAEKAALLSKSEDAVIFYVEGDFFVSRAHYGPIPFFRLGKDIQFNRESVTGRAIIDRRPIQAIHNSKGKKSKFPLGDKTAKHFGYALTCTAPLLFQGKTVGAIMIRRVEPTLFSEKEISLLQNFANQAVIAIEKARLLNETNRLLEETTQRNREITEALDLQTATSDILQIIASSPENLDSILSAIAEKAALLCNSGDAVISYGEGGFLKVRAHYGSIPFLKVGDQAGTLDRETVVGRAIIDGKPVQAVHNQKGRKSEFPIGDKFAKRFGYALTLAAPLLFPGKANGGIFLRRVEPVLFSEREISLLQSFANQAVIAIEKARLLNETRRLLEETTQRNREITEALELQTATSDILEVIASSPEDIDGVLNIIAEKAALLLRADDAVINYVEGGFFNARAHYGSIPFFKLGTGTPFNTETVTGRAIIEGKPIQAIHNPKGKKSEFPLGDKAAKQFGYAMTCAAPLLFQGKAIGAIMIRRVESALFSERDISLLQNFANQAVIAIEKARLLNETKRLLQETTQRNAELAVINSVQQGLASRVKFQEIIDLVGEKVGEIFKADTVTAAMYDAQRDWGLNIYYVDRGRRIPLPDGPIPRPSLFAVVADSRQPLLLGTIEESEKLGAVRYSPGEGQEDQNESILFVPILTGKKVIGQLSVQSYKRNVFNPNDLHLLQTLANSMSVALENARLFDETAQRNAELAVINSVQEAMAKRTDIQGIYEVVGEKIRGIFGAQAMVLGTFDHASSRVLPHYFYEKGERLYPDPLPFTGLITQLISTRQTILINTDFAARAKELGMIIPAGEGGFSQNDLLMLQTLANSKSAVFVPLVAGEKVIGGISLQNSNENAFSASDVRLLETLANSMSVALENARLFDESNRLLEESRRKEAELTTVNTVGQAAASEVDLDALIELIGQQVSSIFKADIAYLALYDKAEGMVRFPYIQGETLEPLKLGEGIVSRVISTGKPLLINSDESWKEAERNVDRVGVMAKSYLGVPILVGKSAIGAISVQSTQKEGRFDAADMNLLSTIAANVGSAIENARLFAEVARQKEYFETFFQYSPAAVVVVDFDGRVISWNPAAESLFGYTAQEAIGKDVDDLVANDPRVEAEARRNTQKFIGERGRVEVKGRRTRKDGSLVDVEVKGLPISVEGEMVGLLVIYHDISEIEQARRAAEEANQAKSAFLANMSHELRTPLNAIIGFTRIVRRKGDDSLPEKQLENLDKVLVSAEHLLGLINTILDIAKIEAGRMELQLSDFDLSALIDSCLATTQPLLKTGDIKLLKSMPPGLPRMRSDQEKIRQILLNLLSNAAKFTHEGSIKANGQLKGEMIVLSVEDSGIGIAEENLHKIFEEFQQADNTTTRQYGGTGLGLSISRSLARLLDGDLTVTSVEGEGSTFSLTTPLHLGKPSSGTEAGDQDLNEADLSLEPDKPLVLVIDDQPDMFHILHQNLGEAGYQVIGALSGEEGIEKARTFHPAAITLDIMMPHMDGWQVLYELKNDRQTKNIPVIILTIVDNKPMGFRMGASDYLMKPLSEKSVLDALERLAKSNGGVRPKRLLVVDDDPKVIDLVHQLLDGKDFVIDTAKDGAEGLHRIGQIQPDVILLDLIMPKLDGFRFIQELRKDPSRVRIPIIVLTAKSLSSEELSLLQKNVSKIVKKQNLGSEELIAEIQKVIA